LVLAWDGPVLAVSGQVLALVAVVPSAGRRALAPVSDLAAAGLAVVPALGRPLRVVLVNRKIFPVDLEEASDPVRMVRRKAHNPTDSPIYV
jgi:hypothetical protein